MKIKANLVYVRDHDLNLPDGKGVQKILQFQTPGGSDVRFTLLVHANDHTGHPAATVRRPRKELTDQELGALLSGGRAKLEGEEVIVAGDEGKEFEIEIRPL